jgi:hypothetical protein
MNRWRLFPKLCIAVDARVTICINHYAYAVSIIIICLLKRLVIYLAMYWDVTNLMTMVNEPTDCKQYFPGQSGPFSNFSVKSESH